MAHIYTNNNNPFKGGKLVNLKQTIIYPNVGDVRFQVQLDKNGQVYEIRRSRAQVIKDPETKKRFVKVILDSRPRLLYDHIKGRPMITAIPWIDAYIDSLKEE